MRSPDIGVLSQEPDIIPLHSMKVILKDNSSTDNDLVLLVRGGGCGIICQDGGLLEKPDIRNII